MTDNDESAFQSHEQTWITLLAERKAQMSHELHSAYREADKIIVTVSSGVLALSIALVTQAGLTRHAWVVKLSWVLFLTAILLVLSSIFCEIQDKRRRITQLNGVAVDSSAWQDHMLKMLNILSATTFVAAVVCLVVFLCANMT